MLWYDGRLETRRCASLSTYVSPVIGEDASLVKWTYVFKHLTYRIARYMVFVFVLLCSFAQRRACSDLLSKTQKALYNS